MSEQTIPVVDLERYKSGTATDRDHFVRALGDALADIGFFAVENHGVDQELIREAYRVAEALFELPAEEKQRYEDPAVKGQRGFTSFGREHAKDNQAPDLKEFWHVGREPDGEGNWASVYGANIWPQHPPEFKPIMLELYRQLESCAFYLLEACALYIGQHKTLLADMARGGDTILRVIHYPPVPADRNPASVRAAAHEDINLITLLCESTAPGLELLQRDGAWRPIHALEGQIIADAGDMLQHVTNGLLRSTTHRVTNPSNDRQRRFSMPFFVHPRGEVDLSPLPSCIEQTGGTQHFPNTSARQFLDERLAQIGLG